VESVLTYIEALRHTSWISGGRPYFVDQQRMSIASTRSCPGLVAHPDRYIIHRNDGLIQVIRSFLNGATNVPARHAASAISGEYAWYTVTVVSS
jgi:hypothetical protein